MLEPTTEGILKGSIAYNRIDRVWAFTADADVMRLMKRMFERIPARAMGGGTLADNTRTCAELLWVIARWRFTIAPTDLALLRAGAEKERQREERAARMLAPDYEPRRFDLALPARDYQRVPPDWCLEQSYCLCADEMGTGKTVIGICLIAEPSARPAMVVCPTALPGQWKGQIERFLPGMRVHVVKNGPVIDLTDGPRGTKVTLPDVVVLSYSKLAKWAEYLGTFCKSAIYDEAQAFRHEWADQNKTTRTKTYSAGLFLRDRLDYRFGLTGTPIFNRGPEIRNVLNVLVADAVGTEEEFALEHCAGSRGPKALVKDPKALGTLLRDKMLMIRRTRADVGRELGACTRNVQIIDCDLKALEAIKTSASEFARRLLERGLGMEETRGAARELDWRLRQATGIAKAPFVAEMAKMLLEGGEPKLVIFTWHKAVNKILEDELSDYEPLFYTGDQSVRQKEMAAKAFIEDKNKRVLVMSNRSAVGLDGLQYVCSCGIIAELDYSPKQHDQNITRLHRDGQKNSVMIHIPMTEDGSDPVIADMLGIKKAQSDGILDPALANALEIVEVPEDRMRIMAERFLEQHNPHLLAEVKQKNAALEAAKEAEKTARTAKRAAGRKSS